MVLSAIFPSDPGPFPHLRHQPCQLSPEGEAAGRHPCVCQISPHDKASVRAAVYEFGASRESRRATVSIKHREAPISETGRTGFFYG